MKSCLQIVVCRRIFLGSGTMDCGHWSQSATQILLKANDPEAFNNINSRHEEKPKQASGYQTQRE